MGSSLMIIQFFITTEISSFILFFLEKNLLMNKSRLIASWVIAKISKKKKMQRDKIVYLDLSISLVHFHNFHVSLSLATPQNKLSLEVRLDPSLNSRAQKMKHIYHNEQIWSRKMLEFGSTIYYECDVSCTILKHRR